MDQFRARPRHRRTVSRHIRSFLSYVWIAASLALPMAGFALIDSSTASLSPHTANITHQVSGGETLWAVARRYGVTVEELVQVNGLNNPDQVYAGQMLIIPRAQPIHTVRVGETLWEIARRYGVTPEEIMAANLLTDRNSIQAGQQLIIPAGAPSENSGDETSYTVKRGDSLYRISLIFGVTVDDLLAANKLPSPNAIYPGLVLRIPTPLDDSPTQTTVYTVQPGDTLSTIAIRFDTTVDRIVAANELVNPSRLTIGQVLNIPAPGAAARPPEAVTATVHRVQAGDTLAGIALRYGVTVHVLAIANDLDPSASLVAGQVLSIPSVQFGAASVQSANVGQGLCQDVELQGSGTGYFIRPVDTYVFTQEFHGWHTGVDLAFDLGTPIHAADSGTVIYAGWNPTGYGNLVVLDHNNGWLTYYAHLNAIYVGCGDWIKRGDILGEMGNTGNSSGPHLHFELLRFGVAVDPTGYIRFR